MSEQHAYRCSEEFAAALRDRYAEMARFLREVVRSFDERHPETPSLWMKPGGFSVDRQCVGFADPGGSEPPQGLSRNRERVELIPRRGCSGEYWREHYSRLRNSPSLGFVFRSYGVDPIVCIGNRVCSPAITDTPEGLFLVWNEAYPEPSEHLSKVPLSVYYAAKERAEGA